LRAGPKRFGQTERLASPPSELSDGLAAIAD